MTYIGRAYCDCFTHADAVILGSLLLANLIAKIVLMIWQWRQSTAWKRSTRR